MKLHVRVSRRSRLATALRAGTASLYINRGRYVHAILCPRPCVAAALPPPRVAAEPRAAKPRVRVSRQSRLAINRSEEIVFDPSSRID